MNMRQLSLQQQTAGQLCQAFSEDLKRNMNNIPTSNIPYRVGGRAPRISCLRWWRSQTGTSNGTARGGGEQLGSSKLVIKHRAARISIWTRPSPLHTTLNLYRSLRKGVSDTNDRHQHRGTTVDTDIRHQHRGTTVPHSLALDQSTAAFLNLFLCFFLSFIYPIWSLMTHVTVTDLNFVTCKPQSVHAHVNHPSMPFLLPTYPPFLPICHIYSSTYKHPFFSNSSVYNHLPLTRTRTFS